MSERTGAVTITPQHWRQRGSLLQLLGHSIFVLDEGIDRCGTLVLLHGFPTSSWDWQPLWADLTKDFRVIALDMLGFGFSDKPDHRAYTIHRQADLVEALVAAKQLTAFHVLAHDYGDTVAQELLARQLDSSGVGEWLSCCFLNGGLFPETHRALFSQKLLLSPLGGLLVKLTGFRQFSAGFSQVFGVAHRPTEHQLNDFWWIINVNQGKRVFCNLITYISDRKLHRERWVSALQTSTIPLAVINGSVDPISGAHMVARYQELGCRLDYVAKLDAVGHYPQVEDPQRVLEHYRLHLQALYDAR